MPKGKYKRINAETRFWQYVDKSGDCWIWLASKLPQGYGRFSLSGRTVRAHRFAYELNVGPIPNGVLCCHKCDNPSCVRPDHLFLGTHADNSADMVRKGRQVKGDNVPYEKRRRGDNHHFRLRPETIIRGSKHHRAKLNEANVLIIRNMLAKGESQANLARRFGVNYRTIHLVAHRKIWVHI